MSSSEAVIRDARDHDAEALFELLAGVFTEYPGCVMERDEMPELRAVATSFQASGGHFWVAELAGEVVGSVGWTPAKEAAGTHGGVRGAPAANGVRGTPAAPGVWGVPTEHGVELKKLYVARTARRIGLGSRLCELVEAAARSRGAAFVDLWSDTRFTDAHRLYERRGYRRGAMTRELHDLSGSVEYYFRLEV